MCGYCLDDVRPLFFLLHSSFILDLSLFVPFVYHVIFYNNKIISCCRHIPWAGQNDSFGLGNYTYLKYMDWTSAQSGLCGSALIVANIANEMRSSWQIW